MNKHFGLWTALLLTLCPTARTFAQTSFRHVIVDAAGPLNPWGKSAGDLNADGKIDLIVGGNKSGGLVYYENPDWKRQVIKSDGRWSTDHEPVDVDGDGDLDIVALTTSELCWLENPGWKNHRIARIVLHDIELADFDGDGDLDIVGRDQGEFGHSGERLHFYQQESDGKWTHREMACPNGEGLAAADVDGDQDMDVLINSVWFENPRAILSSDWRQHVYAERWLHSATFVAPVDLNQDGRIDVVVSPSELAGQRYRISWFEAPPNPRATWREHPVELNVEAVHHFVGAADFDLDGDIDIVSAEMHQGEDPDAIKLYLNAGDNEGWQRTVIDNSGSHSMRLLDFDDDGDIDLFGANHQGSQVDLWVNQRKHPDSFKQTFNPPSKTNWTHLTIDESRTKRCFGIASGDIDGDGDKDLAVGDSLYLNPGKTMEAKWTKHALSPGSDANWITDVGGDGRQDIIAQDLPKILWQDMTESGQDFQTRVVVDDIGPTGHGSSQGFAHADVDGDGREDYVLTSGQGIYVVLIPDDPQETPWESIRITGNSPEEGLALGDIDGDGRADIVAWIGSGSGSRRLGWWRNVGLASELPWPLHEIGSVGGVEGDRIVIGDLNGDGAMDVAATGTTNETSGSMLCWFANSRAFSEPWQRHEIAEDFGALNSLAIADLDADGDLDLVTAEHRGPLRTTVWHNQKDGAEWHAQHISTGIESHLGTHLSDLDNDGDLDIVSIGWDQYETLHLWRNEGQGSP